MELRLACPQGEGLEEKLEADCGATTRATFLPIFLANGLELSVDPARMKGQA